MKRWISLILVLLLVLGAVPMTALAANPFTDVPTYQWYYADVDNAYQNGLINGKTDTLYMPNDFLTYAEAVKLAACMNERYRKGSVSLTNGDPWYQSYVDYCWDKDIIGQDYPWNTPATRAGYMEIFANALPKSAMKEINKIPDGSIPDVSMSHPQAEAIYKLYRVGILQGNDAEHNCNPSANIKRSEVAAILTRMMDSSKRIQFSMDASALRITKNPENVTVKSGETATLSVEAAGGKTPYKYQWSMSRDGAREQWYDVSGKTDATISVKTDASAEGATMAYRCKVTDAAGATLYSDLGSITVSSSDLKIKTQPQGGNVKVSDTMKLSVSAEGGKAPYSYQWFVYEGKMFRDYLPLGGSDKAKNTTTAEMSYTFTAEDGAEKKFRCEITDANGKKVTSDAAVVNIAAAAPLTIVDQPDSYTTKANVGSTLAAFYIQVSGGKAPYDFTWFLGMEGGGISVNSGMDDIEVRHSSNEGYSTMRAMVNSSFEYTADNRYFFYCEVVDANGTKVTSDAFDITLIYQPLSATASGPSRVALGATATLQVVISGGKGPYELTWMGYNADSYSQGFTTSAINWNGVSLSQDGTTLTVDTSKCQAKQFKCEVTDATGASKMVDFSFEVYLPTKR